MSVRGGATVPQEFLARVHVKCRLKSTGGVLTHLAPTNLYRMREKCEKAAKQDSFKSPGALFD